MIRNSSIQAELRNGRITQKTLDSTFLHMIQKGANCPPFVSNAILDTAKKIYRINETDGRYAIERGTNENHWRRRPRAGRETSFRMSIERMYHYPIQR